MGDMGIEVDFYQYSEEDNCHQDESMLVAFFWIDWSVTSPHIEKSQGDNMLSKKSLRHINLVTIHLELVASSNMVDTIFFYCHLEITKSLYFLLIICPFA